MSMIQDSLSFADANSTATAHRVIVRDIDGNVHCGCGNVTPTPDDVISAPFVACSECMGAEAKANALNTTKGALTDAHGADLGSEYDIAIPQPFADLAQNTARRYLPTAHDLHAPFHFVWRYGNRGGVFGTPFALTGTGMWLLATMERAGRYPLEPVTARD